MLHTLVIVSYLQAACDCGSSRVGYTCFLLLMDMSCLQGGDPDNQRNANLLATKRTSVRRHLARQEEPIHRLYQHKKRHRPAPLLSFWGVRLDIIPPVMSSSLNVIALISGGKDSLFSILHCQANGHTVIALANLHPTGSANDNEEDINSYMYQTVGHSVIPLYEQALGLPLFRQEITGTAVNANRDYATPSPKQELDETEDLVPLLRRVIDAHPEANAVSTGAILSTYQRTRVESVALRLGLTPLSYLWQYPLLPPYTQSALLHDMAAVGQKAIIIKTASGGLDEAFLGLDVADQKTIARLGQAVGRFGDAGDGAILGEGGEFETLALDGPRQLWKKRIRLEKGLSGTLDGGQTVLKIRASMLEEKSKECQGAVGELRIPELFDDEFRRILDARDDGSDDQCSASREPSGSVSSSESTPGAQYLPTSTTSDTPTVFTYSNITSDTHPTTVPSSPSRQLINIFLRLDHVLKQRRLSKSTINHCTLLLRDMAHFTVLNPVYAQYFSDVNPPARVTIAVGDALPVGTDVVLSVILDKEELNESDQVGISPVKKRQGLHVQGRSYWAPANIGPYSQAISTPLPRPSTTTTTTESSADIIYIAGQIPLIPASMHVYTAHGFRGQALLSLQHLFRIGRSKRVKWWTAAVAFIPAASAHPDEDARVAQHMWGALHSSSSPSTEEEDADEEMHIDPWDRLNQHHNHTPFNSSTYRAPIPDRTALSNNQHSTTTQQAVPPCFVAQVQALPRGAHIEWSASGLTTSSAIQYERSAAAPSSTTTSFPNDTRTRFVTRELWQAADRWMGKRSCFLRQVGEYGRKERF
ncbi:hypothetical protein BDW02DRAFT_363127 [Decorospora gaudefroyi]|uniref:Diphthine--ammonia ligase n=1 Tax=Decorospora gaudefroyi TaxID=184978 RepID=A0A6A5KR73_9PLEO|nr:hypothetical protein BDW02DRAFT_363127 [Decorospora gaudefroyi]